MSIRDALSNNRKEAEEREENTREGNTSCASCASQPCARQEERRKKTKGRQRRTACDEQTNYREEKRKERIQDQTKNRLTDTSHIDLKLTLSPFASWLRFSLESHATARTLLRKEHRGQRSQHNRGRRRKATARRGPVHRGEMWLSKIGRRIEIQLVRRIDDDDSTIGAH